MVIQLRLVCLVMSTVWAVTTHPRPPPTQSDARYSSPSSCFTSRIIINNDKLACIVLAGACLIALINPTWGDRGEMIILWCAACVAPTSRGWCPGHLMNWSQLFASWAHLRWSAACLLRGMLECWSHYSLLISQCLVVKIVILARLWTLSRHATLFSLQVSHYEHMSLSQNDPIFLCQCDVVWEAGMWELGADMRGVTVRVTHMVTWDCVMTPIVTLVTRGSRLVRRSVWASAI